KVATLVVLITITGYVGYHTYNSNGYEFRASIRAFQEHKNELGKENDPSNNPSDGACLRYVGIKSPLFGYCRFTDVGADETIAVIGDSHAPAAYPGIAEFWKENGRNTLLLANDGCPPYLGVPIGLNDDEKNDCKLGMEQLIGVLLAKKDIKNVYL